jgi:hypothetical protein
MLLKEVRETTTNSYEMDWLKYQLRETEAQLAEARPS